MMDQKKVVALVTGASSGIGAVYAERLARRGHDLLLVARDAARLQQLASRLQAETGAAVEVLPADLTLTADLDRVADRLATDASISFLVNNAGIGPSGPAIGTAAEAQDRMVALNVMAVQRLALAAAEAFTGRGAGTIVTIASVVAFVPERFNGIYAASKAYVLALVQSLAAEAAGKGVRFQAVLPGFTRTEIFDRAGGSLSMIPAEMLMDAGDMVDAALTGLDAGELITIPSLPDLRDLEAFEAARRALQPNLSLSRPAARYGIGG